MIHTKFSEILKHKQITWSRPDDQTCDSQKKKRENPPNSGICRPSGTQKKIKERKKTLDVSRDQKKKAMEYEVDGDTNCNYSARNNSQRLG